MRLLLVGSGERLQRECEVLAGLQKTPCEVEAVASEDEAMVRLEQEPFDLVVCDCTRQSHPSAQLMEKTGRACLALAVDEASGKVAMETTKEGVCPWTIDLTEGGNSTAALERVMRCCRRLVEHEELEARVEQRTAVLKATVWELRQEVVRRAEAEVSLRAEKERFRTLVETVPHGIVELDAEGAYTFANAVYYQLLDAAEGELDGLKFYEPWRPAEEAARAQRWLRRVLSAAPRPTPFLANLVNRRGERLTLKVDWNIKYDGAGKVSGLVAVVSDITAQLLAEEKAQEHLNELAHVTRLSTMGEMVSGLAHELNQPLATISNYAQACRHYAKKLAGDGLADMQSALEQITEQTTRAGEIIRRLRAFVRRPAIERTSAYVGEMIHDVFVLLEVESRVREVTLKAELPEQMPKVVCDRIQIEQVLTNLVKNAMEASEDVADDYRAVTVRAVVDEKEIEISVWDAGKGLAPEDLAHMFEPFYTTKREGMGLGLSISRSIIEAHGGKLRARRNAERGSVFLFTLPLKSEGGNE